MKPIDKIIILILYILWIVTMVVLALQISGALS